MGKCIQIVRPSSTHEPTIKTQALGTNHESLSQIFKFIQMLELHVLKLLERHCIRVVESQKHFQLWNILSAISDSRKTPIRSLSSQFLRGNCKLENG